MLRIASLLLTVSISQFLTIMVAAGEPTGAASDKIRSASQPNILFIFTDDHAYQSISAYGSKINQTPNIDRLARRRYAIRSLLRDEQHLWTHASRDPNGKILAPQRFLL